MKFLITISLLLCAFTNAAQHLRSKKICDLDEKLYETSGLVLIDNKYLITHNDGGNKSEIYVLDLNGKLLKTIEVDEAKNRDWEDLAKDDKGRLYIGDFGDNLNTRKERQIYILRAGFIKDKNEKVNADKITFTYPDQKKFPPAKEQLNYDAEAFIWAYGQLYIFTKCRTKPYTGISNVYTVPATEGNYVAKKIGSFQFCSSNWQWCSVTAADYNPITNELAILTYSKLYLFSNFKGHDFWKGKRKTYNITSVKQREAICYKGKNSWYLTDEYRRGIGGGNLYELSLVK
jgi:hypothetical protein